MPDYRNEEDENECSCSRCSGDAKKVDARDTIYGFEREGADEVSKRVMEIIHASDNVQQAVERIREAFDIDDRPKSALFYAGYALGRHIARNDTEGNGNSALALLSLLRKAFENERM